MRLAGLPGWLVAGAQLPVAPATAAAVPTTGSSGTEVISLEGYGQFSGTVVNTTYTGYALPQPVDAWLGIDYAAQPVGPEGRFRPIRGWPAAFDGVRAAAEYGRACVQAPSSAVPAETQDEACLNFNVYRPQGASSVTSSSSSSNSDKKLLPVLVWIHGGSFNAGSWKSFDGAAFAAASAEPILVVTFHYRVNSLGFLPSALFAEEGLLNLGVRDQHFFLKEFVQKHIAAFGGDPENITIGGRSAGGHSVGIHYFHNYGEDEDGAGQQAPYFARAIHQSGSVTARTFPNATYPLYAEHFATLMDHIGCPTDVDNAAALDCLGAADIDAIRDISGQIYQEAESSMAWPFQPAQGGPMLEKFGSQSGYDGTFHHVPVISSTVTDEAKYYIADDFETEAEFLDYLHNISPALTQDDLDQLAALYPDPATDPASPYAGSPNSTQYNRLAAALSDYAYICPGQETAYRAATAGVPTWKARFDTNNSFPAWQGIPHTADTKYAWNDPSVQHPDVGLVYSGYLTSFVATGDPNARRYPGSPEWPAYEPATGDEGSDGTPTPNQLLIRADNQTKVEPDDIRTEACLYWRDPERAPRLNK